MDPDDLPVIVTGGARYAEAEAFVVAQGELLRTARSRRGLTLHEVEAASAGEFKAASLSAYERGERAISVRRLLRIAEVYQTSIDELLPSLDVPSVVIHGRVTHTSRGDEAALEGPPRVRLDLERLEQMNGPGWEQMKNVVHAIQQRRKGRSARYLVLRGEDLWVVGAIFGTTPRGVLPLLEREALA